MPVTRSASRSDATPAPAPEPAQKTPRATKRKASTAAASTTKKKRSETTTSKPDQEDMTAPPPSVPGEESRPLPAVLTFSFEEAKQHLIQGDTRFEEVFNRLACKPFEMLETVEPFRTLTTSILGQQISWLAARSITYKFLRLYFPELPEKPDEHYWAKSTEAPFPTPHQVANTGLGLLRTAGLSGRKAEYVQDLAKRFSDGRLTSQKLLEANDEELYSMLTAVYGIGRWTVDMFAIFSLRRPDIMPSGDLGVQRGMVRWFLSLHHPPFRVQVSPKKLPKNSSEEPDTSAASASKSTSKSKAKAKSKAVKPKPQETEANDLDSDEEQEQEGELPTINEPSTSNGLKHEATEPTQLLPDDAGAGPSETPSRNAIGNALEFAREGGKGGAGGLGTTPSHLGLPSMPPPFTPSITATLEEKGRESVDRGEVRPLPEGMTVATLKARLDPKKKVKGAILTPKEMEELTEHWRPYRSLAVYYMWALAEDKE